MKKEKEDEEDEEEEGEMVVEGRAEYLSKEHTTVHSWHRTSTNLFCTCKATYGTLYYTNVHPLKHCVGYAIVYPV